MTGIDVFFTFFIGTMIYSLLGLIFSGFALADDANPRRVILSFFFWPLVLLGFLSKGIWMVLYALRWNRWPE